ncbi:MAG: hypothetical protein ACREA9_24420, partial [Pyrinomonadaceae bacterium]
MPFSSNPLLQVGPSARPQATGASSADKAVDALKNKDSGFAQVYSRQTRDKAGPGSNSPVKASDDKLGDGSVQNT